MYLILKKMIMIDLVPHYDVLTAEFESVGERVEHVIQGEKKEGEVTYKQQWSALHQLVFCYETIKFPFIFLTIFILNTTTEHKHSDYTFWRHIKVDIRTFF